MRALFLVPVFLLSGCLTSTYVVPTPELQRLAAVAPEERGKQVRVVQGYAGADQPPEAPHVGVGVGIIVAPVPGYDPYPYGPYGYFRPSTKSMKDEAKAWIALAAILAVGLAVTEGFRYDGWVAVHPMHPVHLYGPGGEWTWVPLAQLTPQQAAWARKGFLRAEEGPTWDQVARAPLDRVGMTYSFLLGSGQVASFDGDKRPGFLSHILIGFHPVQQIGLLFDLAMGWRTDRDFSDIFHSRYAFELQALPIDLGPLHGGVYGEIGAAYRFEDFPDGTGIDRASFLLTGGGMAQLELTTRLALTIQGGIDLIDGKSLGEVTAGVSIY